MQLVHMEREPPGLTLCIQVENRTAGRTPARLEPEASSRGRACGRAGSRVRVRGRTCLRAWRSKGGMRFGGEDGWQIRKIRIAGYKHACEWEAKSDDFDAIVVRKTDIMGSIPWPTDLKTHPAPAVALHPSCLGTFYACSLSNT